MILVLAAIPLWNYLKKELSYDVIIKGGTVYDGSPAAPKVQDIGIRGDKIVTVGRVIGWAKKTIEAKGLIVTPGFIDCHNHTDLMVLMAYLVAPKHDAMKLITPAWKRNHNYATQGVTTIVTGLCGAGFKDLKQWRQVLEATKFASNVYHLIPYGMLRSELFGQNQPTKLTKQQLDKLKKMVAEQMKNGAIGMSVGLEYAPDCFTTTDELVEIAKVVKQYGGIYDAHIRDQTGIAHKNGQPGELESIRETIAIAKGAKIPVQISHIQLNQPWNKVTAKQMADLIEKARKEGVDITADQHPYTAGYAILSYRLPEKYKTSNGVNDKYKNPRGKAEMKAAIKKVFAFLGPEKISLTSGPAKYRNKTIKQIADMEKKDPATVYVELSCLPVAPFALFQEISDKVNREMMQKDYVFTASDGFTVFTGDESPHPRFYGCFPYKIRNFALKDKLLGLDQAIRSMTSLPAQKFKLHGRGMIKAGNYADLAVIDLNRFTEHSTYAQRALYSEGVEYLLVNGRLDIEKGKLIDR